MAVHAEPSVDRHTACRSVAAIKALWAKRRTKQVFYGYLFIVPVIIGFVLFTVGAIGASFYYSFTNADILSPPQWLGARNYRALVQDELFGKALQVTSTFALVETPISIVLALLLAVLLNQDLRGRYFYRLILYLPAVCSSVAVAMVWSWLYHPNFGLLNYLLRLVGLPGLPWLNSTRWALPSLMVIAIWGNIGPRMVIFLAGLQGIPVTLYEAAQIDGAGRWQQFWNITVPMISPTTFFVLVTGLIGAFQIFELAYVATGGGPAYATYTIGLYIFRSAFNYSHMGYAAAMAYVLAFIILCITMLQFAVQKRWVFYE